jgi:hypothetical protein
MSLLKTVGSAAAPAVSAAMTPKKPEEQQTDASMGQRYAFMPGYANPMPGANAMGQEQTYMNPSYRKIDDAEAKKIYGYADGGATANPAAPPVPTSYTAAEPTTPITTPAPAFSIPNVNSMADLVRAPESQGLVNAYLNRPAPVDVQGQYNDYLQSTLKAKPMAVANSSLNTTAPAATVDTSVENIYNPKTQKYEKNPAYKDPNTTKAKSKFMPNFSPLGGPSREPSALGARLGGNTGFNYRGMAGMAEGGLSDAYASGGTSGRLRPPQTFFQKGKYSFHPAQMYAEGGGISDAGYNLGGYSDGGRLLRGPGDGVSDSIPAVIGKKQPARLADGEFVVPARIVSELGNGSTEAGARKLYAMMDRIQSARGKTVGKGKVAKNSRADKYLPA